MSDGAKPEKRENGVSLAPLTFDEAVSGLLRVKPPKKAVAEMPAPKAGAKKAARKKKP